MSSPDPSASSPRREPYTLNEILAAEYDALRPGLRAAAKLDPSGWCSHEYRNKHKDAQEAKECSDAKAENLRRLYGLLHGLPGWPKGRGAGESAPLSAICLSGGGIRSATFSLGVLQSLARSRLLGKFDYLSSVSGGGYIASWLRTWMYRAGTKQVLDELAGDTVDNQGMRHPQGKDPLKPEPLPVRNLRKFSNYLTPRLGLFSGDTWAAAATVVRNLLLNWLVIVPLIAAVIALPLAFLVFVKSADPAGVLGEGLLGIALAVELFASTTVHVFRRSLKKPGTREWVFVVFCAMPIWIAAALLSWAAVELELPWSMADTQVTEAQTRWLQQFALLWCVGIPVLGWLLSHLLAPLLRPLLSADPSGTESTAAQSSATGVRDPAAAAKAEDWRRPWLLELFALIVSGLAAAPLLVVMVENLLARLHARPEFFVMFAVPLLLALYLVARTLFVAFTSAAEGIRRYAKRTPAEDADREWWARLSGWLLLFVTTWIAVTGIVFVGGYLLQRFADVAGRVQAAVGGIGGLAGTVAAYIAKSDKTPAKPGEERELKGPRKWLLILTAPTFVACVIVVITWGAMWLGEQVTVITGIFDVGPKLRSLPEELSVFLGWWVIAMGFALVILAAIFGMFVNVNRFSLHGMYRNRLVRAYLGASNLNRKPDPFTGFDPTDNCKLHEVWLKDRSTRPLPIINTTLNLAQGLEDLAWQERKAESFSMTPFFCGNYQGGYRQSRYYGSGISVGTAVTISGAAANSNMGYASSPALSFLMTLFNVRLGAWLGNTNDYGEGYYNRPGPGQALRPLLNELLGRTSAQSHYVNLSDGGHFENLGLYEVVLRRCRYVLLCDAGQDDEFGFSDLGNAIRKVRIDFGIPIDFEHRIHIMPREESRHPKGETAFYCATARIRYAAVDGKGVPDGVIVYIKPTLHGPKQVPYDVYSYSQRSSKFPHESTADQWFSESQFESYRALGEHMFRALSLVSRRAAATGEATSSATTATSVRGGVESAAGGDSAAEPTYDATIEEFIMRMSDEIEAIAKRESGAKP